MAIWIVVAVRQYGSILFPYFFILAITDPINLLIGIIFRINPPQIFLASSILVFIFLNSQAGLKKNFITSVILLTIITPFTFFVKGDIIRFMMVVVQVMILYRLLKIFFMAMVDKREINLFYAGLILYTITIIIKFFIMILKIKTGILYFCFTSAFEIFIGVFYLFINENSERIKIRLRDDL